MEGKTFKAFVTKYCLTTGIKEVEAEMSGNCPNTPNTIMVKEKNNFLVFYHKNEWFRTYEEAKVNAKNRVSKKIKSLEKSIENLKKLEF